MKNPFGDYAKIIVREEIVKPQSDLERILEVEKEILEKYKDDKRFDNIDADRDIYDSVLLDVQERLKDILTQELILQTYISARDNPEENNEAIVRGFYSGALLEIISTENPEMDIVINGRGKTFNFLFYHVHTVKNLTLTNVNGFAILMKAGSDNGTVQYLTINNITGDSLLREAGSSSGSIMYATLSNIKGFGTLSGSARSSGSIEYVTLTNITGDSILDYAGSNKGSAKNITLLNIKGDGTLIRAGNNFGNATHLALMNIDGNNTLFYQNDGRINKTIPTTTVKRDAFKQMIDQDQNGINKKTKKILTKIETIVETIHLLSFKDKKNAHEEIAHLQRTVFTGKNT